MGAGRCERREVIPTLDHRNRAAHDGRVKNRNLPTDTHVHRAPIGVAGQRKAVEVAVVNEVERPPSSARALAVRGKVDLTVDLDRRDQQRREGTQTADVGLSAHIPGVRHQQD
jgi:hypothetical protein